MKVRVRFTKVGRVRWTSHRDVARMWERALRRARMPVAYTAGFTPRPQLSFGLALPTGCESDAEYLDIALDEPVAPSELARRASPMLPEGVDVVAAAVLEPGTNSLQEDVSSCTWEIRVPGVGSVELEVAIGHALVADSLPITRERKGRDVVDDLRPSVLALSCAGYDADGAQLVAELGTRPRGVRPSELAQALGVELGLARRTCQWIERDGSRWEPLRVDPAGTAVNWERAS
jgi:radical SAM-linked protein